MPRAENPNNKDQKNWKYESFLKFLETFSYYISKFVLPYIQIFTTISANS